VVTVFVPADSKERSDESVIEFTVPIEAEATASPVAIVTSESAPGTPAGLQLSASAQSELTAPVHVDVLMMRLLTLIAVLCPLWGRGNLSGHHNVADEQEPLPETAIIGPCWPSFYLIGSRLASAVGAKR
jgi:hypothetical protein